MGMATLKTKTISKQSTELAVIDNYTKNNKMLAIPAGKCVVRNLSDDLVD